MIAVFRQWRDHSNERPFDPPEPTVTRVKPFDQDAPVISDSIISDHETQDITRLGPLQAYRLAAFATQDGSFAASWSSFVREQVKWHRTLEALRWAYEHGKA